MKQSFFRERLADEQDTLVDIGSDQTSCHIPYQGGYYPVQVNKSDKILSLLILIFIISVNIR